VSTPQPPEIPDPQPPPAAPETAAPTPAPVAPPPVPAAAPAEDTPSTWQPVLYLKIGLLLFAIGYTIAFVVQNTDQIQIDFVFWSAKVRLIWEVLLLLAIGLVGGVLLSQLYRHRRRAQLAKKPGKARDSRSNVGGRDKAVGKPR
jgi:uncharacterized integral membrane protein